MLPTSLEFLIDIDSWQEKYEAIMDFGLELPPLSDAQKTTNNKVIGCQSRVWLDIQLDQNGKVQIKGEADSRLVQGLVAIVIAVYENKTPTEIDLMDETWLSDIGFGSNLSMIRKNGINAMIKKIKIYSSQTRFFSLSK
jgi:cysteine desulfuration protein SufE